MDPEIIIGSLVQEWLTEKVGVVIGTEDSGAGGVVQVDSQDRYCPPHFFIQWQTTGSDMFSAGAGTSEWVSRQSLEVLSVAK